MTGFEEQTFDGRSHRLGQSRVPRQPAESAGTNRAAAFAYGSYHPTADTVDLRSGAGFTSMFRNGWSSRRDRERSAA